jgi:xylulokinase
LYLGMDIGTSSVKAVLVNEAGAIVATAARPLAMSHPAPLWSEQDPDAWVGAAIGAVDDLASAHPRDVARVRGIGLSGQMHGATLLGDDGRPLRPAILE